MEVSSSSAEVPHYFLCPISLEVMRDPVTLATGITYDRASIERWLFSDGHATCPVTRRALASGEMDATPNHTLRRLIQAWCAAHQVERFPTPRPPLDSCRVAALLDEGRHGREAAALREIRAVAAKSDRNRRCVEATPGALDFLVSVVTKHSTAPVSSKAADEFLLDSPTPTSSPAEDALGVLYSLKPSEGSLAQILGSEPDFLDTLTSVLRRPSYRSRTYGILLLKSLIAVMEPTWLTTVIHGGAAAAVRRGAHQSVESTRVAAASSAPSRGSSRRSGRAQQAGAACSAQIGPRRVRAASRLATRHSPARRKRPKGSSSVACGLQASCQQQQSSRHAGPFYLPKL